MRHCVVMCQVWMTHVIDDLQPYIGLCKWVCLDCGLFPKKKKPAKSPLNQARQCLLVNQASVSHLEVSNLTLHSTDTHFDASSTDSFLKNIVGKEEIACNEQFLLFPQCFLLN